MAQSGPGIDTTDEWFVGSINTTKLVLGRERAVVIDNTVSPPTVTINGGGVGDVTGPAGATNSAIATFNGTTGKIIKNNVITISPGGAMSGVLAINGATIPVPFGNVTSNSIPAVGDSLVTFAGTGGKIIQQSSATLDANGNLTLTGGTDLAGIVFPNFVTASEDNLFRHYQQDWTDWDWTGPWAAPRSTSVKIERIGNLVSVRVDLGLGTNNGGVAALIVSTTPLPAWALPPSGVDRMGSVPVVDANVWRIGTWILVAASGTFSISNGADPTATFPVGSTGSSGISKSFQMTYSVA
jgi:hypothetical protein